MSDYFWGGVAVALCVLAARRYFGKKYGSTTCRSCKNCPYARKCAQKDS
jgi:hypothetical protein